MKQKKGKNDSRYQFYIPKERISSSSRVSRLDLFWLTPPRIVEFVWLKMIYDNADYTSNNGYFSTFAEAAKNISLFHENNFLP